MSEPAACAHKEINAIGVPALPVLNFELAELDKAHEQMAHFRPSDCLAQLLAGFQFNHGLKFLSQFSTNGRILPRAAVLSIVIFPLRKILFSAIMRYMKLLNTTEAAERLGVSVRRVRQLIAEGKISAHNLGRDYAIEESALGQVKTYGKAGRPPKVQLESANHKPRHKANGKK